MTFHIITIFPEIFDSYLNEGMVRRAKEKKIIDVKIYDLRDYTEDKHRTVDDLPYGGGAGMVLKVEPIYRCVKKIKEELGDKKIKTILFSPGGNEYGQPKAREMKNYEHLIMICGRYEGVDQRVGEHIVDEEISIGNYILTGGELPALTVLDSVTRLLPGVLGNEESLASESFDQGKELDFPVYTRPEEFNQWKVPEVLLSGNHQEIKKWRQEKKNDKNKKQ